MMNALKEKVKEKVTQNMNGSSTVGKKNVKILDVTTYFFQACKLKLAYTDILFNVIK